MDAAKFIEIIIGALTLLGVIAGAVFIVRSSALKTAAETWREEAEAQKARADRYEIDVTDLKTRVAKLEDANAELRDLATGASALVELRALSIEQHAQVMAEIRGHK